jgi:hypothetical protein
MNSRPHFSSLSPFKRSRRQKKLHIIIPVGSLLPLNIPCGVGENSRRRSNILKPHFFRSKQHPDNLRAQLTADIAMKYRSVASTLTASLPTANAREKKWLKYSTFKISHYASRSYYHLVTHTFLMEWY